MGDVIGPVEIGPVAHGGHWVGRWQGRVVFVRHALTGERVLVRVTAVAKRHAFGDAVEVLDAAPERVEPPCPIAADCGGCDFQHATPTHQRELKRRVVAEQLHRLAGLEWDGEVEAVEPLIGWRTRVRYHADPSAGEPVWGMHPPRSHAITPLPERGCLIAAPGLERPPAAPTASDTIAGAAAASGVVWFTPGEGRLVRESAAGRDFAVRADGFWQVHPRAAETLVAAVMEGLDPQAGERGLDLYCGVGLFAGALAARGVEVIGMEGSRSAVELAGRNVPEADFLAGSVGRLESRVRRFVDLVVLDPPRTGAGASVIEAVLARRPRAIAYVACDPAALARDLGYARAAGWEVDSLRAFDLFGMTHHIECVAILRPGGDRDGDA